MESPFEDTLNLVKRVRGSLDDDNYCIFRVLLAGLPTETDVKKVSAQISILKKLFAVDDDLFTEVKKFFPQEWNLEILGRKRKFAEDGACQDLVKRTRTDDGVLNTTCLGAEIQQIEGGGPDEERFYSALKSVARVRSVLRDKKFHKFHKILVRLRSKRGKGRTARGISRMKKLFAGHDDLLLDLKEFFPWDFSVDSVLEARERKRHKVRDGLENEKISIDAEKQHGQTDQVQKPFMDGNISQIEESRYEQELYDCEDNLFEASMKLQSLKSTIEKVHTIANRITHDGCLISVDVEEGLGEESWAHVISLFQENFRNIVLHLIEESPKLWIPIILRLLEEESVKLTALQFEVNERWEMAIAGCHCDVMKERSIAFLKKAEKVNNCSILIR